MKLSRIIDECELEKVAVCSDCEIETGYCGDLMSDVIAHTAQNCIWVTIQAHKNSIAVAVVKDIRAIIFTNNAEVEPEVVKKANEEKINLLRTKKDSFTVCGEIHHIFEKFPEKK